MEPTQEPPDKHSEVNLLDAVSPLPQQSGSEYQPSDNEELENDNEGTVESANLNEDVVDVNEGRKRHIKANEMEWVRNKNKKLRMKGQEYLGVKKDEKGKLKQNVVRNQRKIKSTCSSRVCQKSSNRHCNEFSEKTRNNIFTKFWESMNWDQRRVFVSSNVKKKHYKTSYSRRPLKATGKLHLYLK